MRLGVCIGLAGLSFLGLGPAVAHAAEGDLDAAFAGDGTVRTELAGGVNGFSDAVAADSQSRVVAAGRAQDGDYDFSVIRYTENGLPDSTFSGDGEFTHDFGGTLDDANGVVIDAGGGVIVVGESDEDFAMIRLTPQGGLDTSFGTGGVVTSDFYGAYDAAEAVAIDAQGRIVVGGTTRFGGDTDFAVARYTSTGDPDLSFHSDGERSIDLFPTAGDQDWVEGMALDPQGRIVLAGRTETPTLNDVAVVRVEEDGDNDPTFDEDGRVTTPVGVAEDRAADVEIDAQGRIVVGGSAGIGSGAADFAVLRYLDTGALDPSFDGDGIATISMGALSERPEGIEIDAHGRIVIAGFVSVSSGVPDGALARFNPDGRLDFSFGSVGKVITPDHLIRGLTIDGKYRIVAVGGAGAPMAPDPMAARYIGDATAPNASIDSGPAAGARIKDPRPKFGLASDESAAFTCGFDGGLAPCSSPAKPGGRLGDGKHTFVVVAMDPAGNTSAPVSRRFTVDTRKPKLKIKGKTKLSAGEKANLKLKASEPAKLKCKLDKGKSKKCKKKYRSPKLDPGKHKLVVTATDRAGNKGKATARLNVG